MASSHGSTAAPPVQFGTERRAGRLGPISVGHLVVVELVAVALLGGLAADHGTPGPWFALAAVASALVLVGAFARTRGGWWYERRALRSRWRRRRRRIARTPAGRALDALAPGLSVREVEDRGTRIGVGQDEDGWFAVLAVGPRTGPWGEGGEGIRLDRLTGLLTDASVPVSSISVVSQAVPAPGAVLDPQSRAAQSYRQLVQNDPVLAEQAMWVTVRLSPADAAGAAANRGGGLAGVDRAIAAALGRVGKTLSTTDLPVRVLDPTALADALTTSSGLATQPVGVATSQRSPATQPVGVATSQRSPATQPVGVATNQRSPAVGAGTEEWTSWQAGGVGNVGFWLSRWPRGPVEELFAALTRIPAALVSVAVTVQPSAAEGQLRVACLVRVAADPKALPKAAGDVVDAARQAGARLRRLDGEHGLATYATLPTAAAVAR
jgi:type VII secretion protein EccE